MALRTIFRPNCTILCDFAYKISKFFRGNTPTPHRSALVLGPGHQFPLGSPAFPLFLFYETTTGHMSYVSAYTTFRCHCHSLALLRLRMTYIVSSGALNSTHSLTHSLALHWLSLPLPCLTLVQCVTIHYVIAGSSSSQSRSQMFAAAASVFAFSRSRNLRKDSASQLSSSSANKNFTIAIFLPQRILLCCYGDPFWQLGQI